MPLPMIHLSVAINIVNDIEIEKSPQFFLGCISPDAIHMRTATGKDDKSKTHCAGETKEKTLENIRCMLREAKKLKDSDLKIFILGYCTHILTDLVWIENVRKPFLNRLAESAILNDSSELYYKETDFIDFKIFREATWKERVWKELSICKAPDYLDLLTSEEIEKWKVRTLTWFEDEEKDPKIQPEFIKEEIIEKFVLDATDFVNKEIIYFFYR